MNSSQKNQSIILCGFKSSGKSYLGQKLAETLELPFVDTDDLMEKLYWEQTNIRKSCKEIYQELGEEEFRNLENLSISQNQWKSPCVCATGGGSLVKEQNVEILKEIGFLVYLDASKEVILSRLGDQLKSSPLLFKKFESLWEERRQQYLQLSDETLKIVDESEGKSLFQLIKIWIKKQ